MLFIVIESLRYDHVGCYGYERETTPNIDKIAREGVRFEQAVAASGWTMPSVMTMFTSTYASIHNAKTYKHRLAEGLTTLAAELRKAGYQTVGVVSNPTLHGKFGFSRGFDLYDDYTVLLDAGLDLMDDMDRSASIIKRTTSEQVTRLARNWIAYKRDKRKPFFLFLFYFDPHYDYLPPRPYNRQFTDSGYKGKQKGHGIKQLKGKTLSLDDKQNIIALYDGEIRYTDYHVGKVIEELKKRGLYDETMILITGDHGEEFWDHDDVAHGHTLYEELLRVPLVIRHPGGLHAGTVIKEQVSHFDIMPTLLHFAGRTPPDQCRGLSILPLLKGENGGFVHRSVFLESEIEGIVLKGVRTSKLKLIEKGPKSIREMYVLSEDAGEQKDLAATGRAQEFAGLEKIFAQWRKEIASPLGVQPDQKIDLDPQLIRQLKSLGYVR